MSGDQHYYFGSGDHVTMHGGEGNTGIDKRVVPAPELSEAAQEALQQLLPLVTALRAQVPAASAQTLDEALPALQVEAPVQPPERHRALLAVAGIAAAVGGAGAQVFEAANKTLELLGAK